MDEEDLIELALGVGDIELVGDELDDLMEMISGEDDDDDDDDDDELGDLLDDDDDVGARRGRRRRRRRRRGSKRRSRLMRAVRKAAARNRATRQGKRAVPATRAKGRVLMLGGENTAVTAGQLLIATTVQETARIDRLFVAGIDKTGAVLPPASYSIGDIKVGTSSQLAGLPPLPGIMFTQDATSQGQGLQLDTTQPGTDFTVVIANAPAGSTFNWGAYASAIR